MTEASELVVARLRAHLRAQWPHSAIDSFFWDAGPIDEALPDFRVWRITPAEASDAWIYVSEGAWAVETAADYRIEFLLMAPEESPIHVETLAMVAHFHADTRHRLDAGYTMNIGRGWTETATLTHLLVSVPYPIGPSFEFCKADSLTVRYLWLLPVTESEVQYRHREGLEALEALFDEKSIETLDPVRESVV